MTTAKRIWLATLLVVCVLLAPAVSLADTVQLRRTDELIAVMREAVAAQYQVAPQDVLIVWNDQDLQAKLARMGAGLTVEITDQELRNLVQRESLSLKVMEGTRYKGRVPVRVKVDGWAEVYQSARPIAKGELLDPDSVTAQRVKLSALPPQTIRPPFRMEDFLARQDIPAKTLLKPALLVERPLVEKGNTVKLILIQGALKLVAAGEALESGPRNAMIRVRVTNFDTNKIIRARVTGESEVTLEIVDG